MGLSGSPRSAYLTSSPSDGDARFWMGKPRPGWGTGLAGADTVSQGHCLPGRPARPPRCWCPAEGVRRASKPLPAQAQLPGPSAPAAWGPGAGGRRSEAVRSSCLDLLHICSSFHAPRAPRFPRSAINRRKRSAALRLVSTLSRALAGAGGGSGEREWGLGAQEAGPARAWGVCLQAPPQPSPAQP